MNNKERRNIVKKGNKIKEIIDNGCQSILIIGEEGCGKSMLFSYLENSLKEEPAVFELNTTKGNRKYKLKDISLIPYNIVLIDDANRLHTESIVSNLISLDNNNKKIIMFSRESNNTEDIKSHVEKTFLFSEMS